MLILFYGNLGKYGIACALGGGVGDSDAETFLREALLDEVAAYLLVETVEYRAVGIGRHLALEGECEEAVTLGYGGQRGEYVVLL